MCAQAWCVTVLSLRAVFFIAVPCIDEQRDEPQRPYNNNSIAIIAAEGPRGSTGRMLVASAPALLQGSYLVLLELSNSKASL